jgi:hypothetical protein
MKNKAKEFESFSLPLDKSNVTSDATHLLIFIRGITEYFMVV